MTRHSTNHLIAETCGTTPADTIAILGYDEATARDAPAPVQVPPPPGHVPLAFFQSVPPLGRRTG